VFTTRRTLTELAARPQLPMNSTVPIIMLVNLRHAGASQGTVADAYHHTVAHRRYARVLRHCDLSGAGCQVPQRQRPRLPTKCAHRAGITHLVIPKENEADLDDVPQEVRDVLSFHAVETLEEVFKLAGV